MHNSLAIAKVLSIHKLPLSVADDFRHPCDIFGTRLRQFEMLSLVCKDCCEVVAISCETKGI